MEANLYSTYEDAAREYLDKLNVVRLLMTQLERLYYCYRVSPFAGKLVHREPKLCLYDWSEIPKERKRFENLMASALLRWCDFAEDYGQEKLGLHFIRDKEKREVDFLLTLDGGVADPMNLTAED